MFPVSFVDKTECLEALVGIRTQCSVDKQYPAWIEDIEGVDVKKLAAISKASNPSGKDFGSQLINIAARQMMGDLEVLLNDGYKMNNIVGDMCSTCSLIPSYVMNTGIVIKSAVASRFQIIRITKLTILANHTGAKQITIDDGVNPRYFNVNLIANTLMPVAIEYSTTAKAVKVFFTDNTVPLGIVSCATPTSCGCGGSTNTHNPVNIKGLVAGVESATQYGFLPCVAINCSYDTLVCNLIQQAPNIFGLTMFYKVAELYYDNKKVSDRNNDAVSFNDDPKEEFKKNYAGRYWAKMKGTGGMMGINKLVSDYLRKNRADKCVACETKLHTAYTTG